LRTNGQISRLRDDTEKSQCMNAILERQGKPEDMEYKTFLIKYTNEFNIVKMGTLGL